MDVTSGTVAVSGRIAYVSQQAWVTNDTLQDNILFGSSYEADRYIFLDYRSSYIPQKTTFVHPSSEELYERNKEQNRSSK